MTYSEKAQKLLAYYSTMSQGIFFHHPEGHKRRIFRTACNEHNALTKQLWDLERKIDMYADSLIPTEKHFDNGSN